MTHTESEFLADQLRRASFGEAWHGPSLLELISDLSEQTANRRVRDQWHSIRELVLHVTAWQSAGLAALRGKNMPPLNEPWEGDWPVSHDAWPAIVSEFRSVSTNLIEAVSTVPLEKLSQPVPGRDDYDFRFLLHGIAQHTLYHAGQIALLRK